MNKKLVIIASLLIGLIFVTPGLTPVSAAPILPLERYGEAKLGGTPVASGKEISSWIDGVKYGNTLTTAEATNYQIQTLGTDWDPSLTIQKSKTGAEDGDNIYYILKDGTNYYVAAENDTYQFNTNLSVAGPLTFVTAGQPDFNLKIYNISVHGNWVELKNYGTNTIDLAKWSLKKCGQGPGQYSAWSTALTGSLEPGKVKNISIPAGTLSATAGDLELCFQSADIARGSLIVLDRVEWSSTATAHDSAPSNTSMVDWVGNIPAGYLLHRKTLAFNDTDNCANDFELRKYWSPRPQIILTSVVVSPSSTIVAPNGIQEFTATPKDQNGVTITTGVTFSWTVDPTTLGTVSGTGATVTFTAGATEGVSGKIFVNVTHATGTKQGFATITIRTPPPFDHVSIIPASLRIERYQTVTGIKAHAWEDAGETREITAGLTFSWTVNPTTLGNLSANNTQTVDFTAGSIPQSGTLHVDVTYQGMTKSRDCNVEVVEQIILEEVRITPSSATVNVSATQRFTAKGYSGGYEITGVTFTWTLSPSTLGTLDTNTGPTVIFTASNVGTGTLEAKGTYRETTVTATATIKVIQPPPMKGTLTGRITDSATGSPISGATIKVMRDSITVATAVSDTNGNYTIALDPGTYNVTVSAPNYQDKTESVVIVAGQTITKDFQLTKVPTPGFETIGVVCALSLLIWFMARRRKK